MTVYTNFIVSTPTHRAFRLYEIDEYLLYDSGTSDDNTLNLAAAAFFNNGEVPANTLDIYKKYS